MDKKRLINEEKVKIQNEAFAALEANNFNGAVILPTGTGKTLVLINCFKALWQPGMRVLYTCDSKKLRDEGFDEELKKWGYEETCKLIEKQCYAGAYKKEGEYYDILLADEGDYALTPAYSKLFLNNKFKHIIFVSATLDAKKRKIAKDIVKVVYEKKIKEIEEKKVVNKANFFLVPYVLNRQENAKYIEFNEKFTKLIQEEPDPKTLGNPELLEKWKERKKKNLEFLNLSRIHFLANLDSSAYICRKLIALLDEENPENRVIVFCGLTDQADRICKYSFHSGNETEGHFEKFEKGEINKIAVCSKVDRGINVKGVNKMILENYNSSETKLVQRTGRGRRLDVDKILDVYVLVPYFKRMRRGQLVTVPTIMDGWIKSAGRNLGIENAKTIYLK